MKPLPILLLASFIWMITAMQVIAQEEGGAIATLSRVEGYVEVFSEAKRKTRRGREGLMLFAGERINTGKTVKSQSNSGTVPPSVFSEKPIS